MAFSFILLGLFRFFVGASFGGLWLAFIGWFLHDASRASYVQVELIAGLRDRRVADIMDHVCPTEGHLTQQDFVDDYVFRSGRRCFVVVQNGRVTGLITPHEVRTVDRASWSQTSVQSVMRPLGQLRTVTPDTPAVQALELMSREDINQLPVVSDGHLEGIFSRGHVLNFLRAHAELQHDQAQVLISQTLFIV